MRLNTIQNKPVSNQRS